MATVAAGAEEHRSVHREPTDIVVQRFHLNTRRADSEVPSAQMGSLIESHITGARRKSHRVSVWRFGCNTDMTYL